MGTLIEPSNINRAWDELRQRPASTGSGFMAVARIRDLHPRRAASVSIPIWPNSAVGLHSLDKLDSLVGLGLFVPKPSCGMAYQRRNIVACGRPSMDVR
jgi:hypothetical protein